MKTGLAGCAALLAFLFATPVFAQLGLGFGADLSISFSPAHPRASEAVQLTARSSGLDLSGSEIVWRANGKEIARGSGLDSTNITAGNLGEETRITVDATQPDGTSGSAQATIIPTGLDILVDSDSYIPPFYRGRARASAGTNLLLQALPEFKLPTGSMAPASDLIYTWRRNGEVIGTVSGRGRSTAIIPSPHLFGTDTITVEAKTPDGTLSGASTLSLSSTEPVLALYEDHPLFGILYNQALGGTTFIPESEMAFAAVPYFAQIQNASDPRLVFDWRVNGSSISPSISHPNEITINANNSTGIALLSLELTHTTNYYMDARGSWNINFSSRSSGAAQDQFHTSSN